MGLKVKFDRKWVNPLFHILNEIIKDDTIRTVLIYGGKSSAKTATVCQILAKELVLKQVSSIAFRKESVTIPETLKKSLKLARQTLYLWPAITVQDRRFITDAESEIVMKGLDDEEKAKGVESYKYLFLDEVNHFSSAEYTQFDLSLRGIPGQKIFAAWNPVDERSWVKTELVDPVEWVETQWKLPCPDSFVRRSADGDTILIKTTYPDNYWIVGSPCGTYGYRDENLIKRYEDLRTKNYNSYRVNVLGEWGKTEFGGEFLKSWRSELHVKECPYNPKLAVRLIFDENVNPYFPCGIFQLSTDGKEGYLIHAIAKKNPENTVRHICADIRRKLQQWGHQEAVYIGGDATSLKQDVKQEKGHNLFTLIMAELKDYRPRLAVGSSNPSVRMSADFFNAVLEYNEQGLKFFADPSCKVAINDYENTKEDKNGGVDKKTVTDPVTKVSYQPFGHFVDLTRYFVCDVWSREYLNYQRGGLGSPITGKHVGAKYKF